MKGYRSLSAEHAAARKAAYAAGHTTFTGDPCVRCGNCERNTKLNRCTKCLVIDRQRWHAANRDKTPKAKAPRKIKRPPMAPGVTVDMIMGGRAP